MHVAYVFEAVLVVVHFNAVRLASLLFMIADDDRFKLWHDEFHRRLMDWVR